MPTLITPLRANNAYFGIGKQAIGGTAVAPSMFPRWLDGTSIAIDISDEEIVEGDASRHVGLVIKNKQVTKLKLVTWARPIIAGMLEEMGMGVGSDVITASTPSTTTNTVVTGGSSTTVGLVSGTGFTSAGAGTFALLVGTGTATDPYETVTFTVPVSGTTLTVAAGYNGGKFKQSHPSGTTIASVASVNTSFTSAASVGATTVVLGNNNGLTGAGTAVIALSAGTANEEIVTVTTPGTGTGPYTYTIANAGVTAKSHSIGDLALTAVAHVLTDQTDGDYYTCEVNLGGASGITIRVRDCKAETIKRSSDNGKLVKYEVDLIGIACAVQGSPSVVTLENHQPFLFTQANGAWNIDGSLTGDALAVEKWDITTKNNLDQVQTEQVTLAASIFGKVQVEANLEVVYTNNTKIGQAFFGGASGTSDVQATVNGSFTTTFTAADGLHLLTFTLATLVYTKVTLPVPKSDGKAFVQPILGKATSNNGLSLFVVQTTVNNLQTTNY